MVSDILKGWNKSKKVNLCLCLIKYYTMKVMNEVLFNAFLALAPDGVKQSASFRMYIPPEQWTSRIPWKGG
jgi:hypothetical protein